MRRYLETDVRDPGRVNGILSAARPFGNIEIASRVKRRPTSNQMAGGMGRKLIWFLTKRRPRFASKAKKRHRAIFPFGGGF